MSETCGAWPSQHAHRPGKQIPPDIVVVTSPACRGPSERRIPGATSSATEPLLRSAPAQRRQRRHARERGAQFAPEAEGSSVVQPERRATHASTVSQTGA